MTRDFCREMRSVIDQATAEPGYIPGAVAAEIVAKLRATDRELLRGWLEVQAEQFVREAIGARDRSIRARTRQHAGHRDFAAAAAAHAAGGGDAIRSYLHMPFTIADGSHQVLANLTRADLLFVADDYKRRASENAFYENVMRAIAKKVGRDKVSDHFTDAQLAAMFDGLDRAA